MELASSAAAVDPTVTFSYVESNRDRLKRVFRTSCDGIYRFIYVRVGNDGHAADDVLQQTCAAAVGHRNIPQDDRECEAWMYGIARNLIRRYWRQNKRQKDHVSLDDVNASRKLVENMTNRSMPVGEIVQDDAYAQLTLAMTSLPSADQRLIFDFYFDGQSQAQIAQELDTTTKSIETKLYRIRNRLRSILQNNERTGGS